MRTITPKTEYFHKNIWIFCRFALYLYKITYNLFMNYGKGNLEGH